MAYAQVEPFGEMLHEVRHGQAMAMTANINRDTEKRKAPFEAKEFMNFLFCEQPTKDEPKAEDPKVLAARIARELFGFRLKR